MSGSGSVTYVGHATVLIELDGVRLLTDPVLRRHVGPLVRHGPAPSPRATANLDAVLISHLHRDHVDLGSLRRLGRGMRLLVPSGSRSFFERHGFADVTELSAGDSADIGALTVTAVEAHHDGGGRRHAPAAPPVGYLVRGRRSVYFAGDTDLFAGMADLASGLDLALLPIWGWGPTLGPDHLDPARAAEAAALLSPRLVVPIHWGTLYPLGLARFRPGRLRLPGEEFAAGVRELAPQVATRVLSPGESTALSPE
jgi:L-ascorbate metabolism protein UlaG (beta-lactamase superfamily)